MGELLGVVLEECLVAEHELDRDGAQELVLDFEVFEIDKLGVIAASEGLGVGALVGFQVQPSRNGERNNVGFVVGIGHKELS